VGPPAAIANRQNRLILLVGGPGVAEALQTAWA